MAGIFDCNRSAFRHTFGVKVLKMDRPAAGGFLSLTALRAEGYGGGFAAIFKVSVTGLAFWVRWHDKHYDDEPPSVAFPPLVPYGTTFPPRYRSGDKRKAPLWAG